MNDKMPAFFVQHAFIVPVYIRFPLQHRGYTGFCSKPFSCKTLFLQICSMNHCSTYILIDERSRYKGISVGDCRNFTDYRFVNIEADRFPTSNRYHVFLLFSENT